MVLGDQEYSKSYGYGQTPATAGTAKNWRTQAGWTLSVSLSLPSCCIWISPWGLLAGLVWASSQHDKLKAEGFFTL